MKRNNQAQKPTLLQIVAAGALIALLLALLESPSGILTGMLDSLK